MTETFSASFTIEQLDQLLARSLENMSQSPTFQMINDAEMQLTNFDDTTSNVESGIARLIDEYDHAWRELASL